MFAVSAVVGIQDVVFAGLVPSVVVPPFDGIDGHKSSDAVPVRELNMTVSTPVVVRKRNQYLQMTPGGYFFTHIFFSFFY